MLFDLLLRNARLAPDAEALVDGDRVLTFGDLLGRVSRLGGALDGVSAPGDRVALLSTNRAEFVEAQYAVPCAGRTLVLLNYRLHPREWAGILRDCGAGVLIAEPALWSTLSPLADELPATTTVLFLDDPAAADAHSTTPPSPYAWPTLADDDPAFIIYTSGTTGFPKGAVLTHRNVVSAAMMSALDWDLRDDERFLMALPMCHASGLQTFCYHLRGALIVLMPRYDSGPFLDLVDRHQITQISLAPTMLAFLLDDPSLPDRDLSRIRRVGYGGMIMSPDLARRVMRRIPKPTSGFGQSESTMMFTRLSAEDHQRALDGEEKLLTSVGRPSPTVRVEILDEDDRPCPPGEIGELCLAGDTVMRGYWKDEERTAQALRGGWLHTGDLARQEDGYIYLVDRKKDMLISGGQNIYPRELELVMLSHPAIRDVAVIGVPDDVWGESVAAYIVPEPGAALTEADVIAHTQASLAGYKKPKHVVIVNDLPRNQMGKVVKNTLRQAFADQSTPPSPR
ncbi:Fatty-acid--CoA ligase [Frankia canadensis]|uniref:Fatty-acid--CoA ligase n=1 Tax=Frankia canadensis TaxID=1836972 RepID=A0A2I2KUV3_9ACTN|nr:long-chain fatty acid--CoA ligase [Frankia canadensis]SNQ49431.1 Fatty-acid--CoA ligase [Frankia canadensis]SOU56721.1 Fatty-acid--CoA ligase [Frankia canadensis]